VSANLYALQRCLCLQIFSKALPLVVMVSAMCGVGYGGYNLILKEPGN
jgi:hypothetical protein